MTSIFGKKDLEVRKKLQMSDSSSTPSNHQRQSPFKIRVIYGQYNMEKKAVDLLLGSELVQVSILPTQFTYFLQTVGRVKVKISGSS